MKSSILTIQTQSHNSIRFHRIRIPIDQPGVSAKNISAVKIVNTTIRGYSLFKDAEFILQVLKAIRKIKAAPALALNTPLTGVPGVFSIASLPEIGPDGRLGFRVSGMLFERISGIWVGTQKVFSNGMFYSRPIII